MISMDKNVGEFLRDAFLQKRAAHAYIVVGEKQQLPLLLKQCATVCICKNHLGDDCEFCKKVQADVHQDVLWFPKDKKSRLNVGDMALLVEECFKRPIDGGDTRVFLLDASNSTTGVASEVWQNKLLKTLEEPTENIYLFIGVTDYEALLPTVRSRCQVLKQTKYSQAEILEILQRRGYEKRYCEIAASIAGGSPDTAESILVNHFALDCFDLAAEVLTSMSSSKNALPFVSEIVEKKDYLLQLLGFLTVLLRESIVYRLAEGLRQLPSFDDTVEKICKNYSLQAAEVCIEKINDAKKRLDDGGNVTVIVDELVLTVLEVKYRCRI